MTMLWWAGDRVTEPPKISLISNEERKIAVGLTESLNEGESILSGTIEVDILRWRDGVVLVPTPAVGNVSYDAGTKTVAQTIDASLMPKGVPYVMIVSFDVNYGMGTDRRSSYVILMVEV